MEQQNASGTGTAAGGPQAGRPSRALAVVFVVVLVGLPVLVGTALRSTPRHDRAGPDGSEAGAVAAAAPVYDAESLVAAGVGEAYPGGVLAVGRGGRIERLAGIGKIGWRAASPPVVADSTIYDLASLTKAMATTMAVLLLVQDGRIALDEPVRRHLPGFEGRWKDDVTWRHLLTHTSGLPPGAAIRGTSPEERLRRLLRTLLLTPPGRQVEYSDIGYVVLWAAATRAAGEPLPALLRRRVWEPLGMRDTGFAPGTDCDACAPSLRLSTGQPFRGLPSDLLARRLGNVAGHAGLFATAPDVARFTAMIAGGGELDGVRILDAALVGELLRQQPGAGRRTLGWTAFCPDEQPRPSQPCARPIAYGHTGWTGTSLQIAPEGGHWVVLLTNRSYERSERPVPLEMLRRDLILNVAGVDRTVAPERWLAAAMPAPRDVLAAGSPAAPATADAPPAAAPF
jgi:serine-type D-Ala-D-Ala carboxypeptidase